jgi:hypothetical protein
MVPRNFKTSKLFQVRCEPLRVEQNEFVSAQMIYQRHECNLGGIGHPMKHRFPKKRASNCDTVKAAGELAFLPSFDGMRVAELMQTRVALDDLVIDPRIFPFRAGSDHFRKCVVNTCFKDFLAQHTSQGVRDMKIVQWQNGTRIWRKPLDRVILHGHRENTKPIALQQKFRINHSRYSVEALKWQQHCHSDLALAGEESLTSSSGELKVTIRDVSLRST